jgi:hypothetical protein
MRLVHQICHLVRADFLERVRRFSFLVVMGLALFAGYMFVPPLSAPYTSFIVASHRGYYNSPWVGTLFGVTAAILLSLIGFYLVKNSISRDYDTRVGQIIATTPLRKITYMAGKWFSNVLVLATILGVLTVIAPVMQLVRAEVTQVDLMALWAPIWLMGFPALAFAAAMAVLFESVAILRGGLGNIIYFFIWGPILIGSSARSSIASGESTHAFDFAGVARIVFDIKEKLTIAGVDIHKGFFGVIGPVAGNSIERFMWEGVQWTPDLILERFLWVGLGAVAIMIATIPFNRFDPAGSKVAVKGSIALRHFSRKIKMKSEPNVETAERYGNGDNVIATDRSAVNLTPVNRDGLRTPFISIVTAELLLMLKGRSWWWYLCALGLIVATPFVPSDRVAQMLFAAAWLWPILVWSEMGVREIKYQTYQTVFSTAHPVRRQFPAIWLAGVVVAIAMGAGFALRMIGTGSGQNLYAVATGALFIPSLALALGAWTNGSRTFEIVYLLLWYMSIQSGATVFDYRGATAEAISSGIPLYYIIITIILIVLAVLGRQKQICFQ